MIIAFYRYITASAALGGILICLLLSPPCGLADIYRYVDENQVVHLTNVPTGPKFRLLIKDKPFKTNGDPYPAYAEPYDSLIMEAAAKYGVDCNLVKAIIKVESNFNHRAISRKGAKGLMQLMPRTAEILGVTDCFHPGTNIDGGIRYLSYLIGIYNGNLPLALAAYNAGEGAVARYGDIPPYAETRNYVRQVIGNYERYRRKLKPASVREISVNHRDGNSKRYDSF
jgi:hypothetical protein